MTPKPARSPRSQRLAANAAVKEQVLHDRIIRVVAAAQAAELARLGAICPQCTLAPCPTPRSCMIRFRARTQHRLREAPE